MKGIFVIRGERMLIPEEVRANVLAAGQVGHLGTEAIVRQLRKSI